jgi:hypothetical protein
MRREALGAAPRGGRGSAVNARQRAEATGLPWVSRSRVAGFLMPRWTCSRTVSGSACRGCCGGAAGCGRPPGTQNRIRHLYPSPPAAPVQQLDLHPRPERLDHRVVVAIADAAHRGTRPESLARWVNAQEANWAHSLVGVDDRPGRRGAAVDGHAERVGDQRRGRGGIDPPADHPAE